VTIRAKLYAALAVTVAGLLVTAGVGIWGMSQLGDRFDEVQRASEAQALALQLKFDVTDFNGWQTAYGYDDGASRPRFESSVRQFRVDFATAGKELTDRREQQLLGEIDTRFDQFMALDDVAYAALRRGDDARVKQIFLGPELRLFDQMASRASELASYEARGATATEKAFDDAREDSRRGLIAVGLGAGLVIVLLLVAAADIARLAIEGHRVRE
jgi:hypothetical protein